MTTKEYEEISYTLQEFLDETTAPYELMEPWNIVNEFFVIDKNDEAPILYLKVWTKRYSLGSHSTLDTDDAKNFIVYARILCKNLLLGPIKTDKNENIKFIWLN